MRVLGSSAAVDVVENSPELAAPPEAEASPPFDLEAVYDETFRRAPVLRVAPVVEEPFRALSLSDLGDWESIEAVPGGWSAQVVQDFSAQDLSAQNLSAPAEPTGWAKLDHLCKEEYEKYRENPTEENFNELVAAFALPQYTNLHKTLTAAHARLQDPDELAALASGAGLEAYDLNKMLTAVGTLEYVFAQLPEGECKHANLGYMQKLKEKYPGRSDYSQFDISKMTKEQLLSLPLEKRELILGVLESLPSNFIFAELGAAMRTFTRMNIDGNNYQAAVSAASGRYGELMREYPELIALLREDSPFSYDLCARAAPHTFKFDGAGFQTDMDSDRQAKHVYERIAAMGPGAFSGKIKDTLGELEVAIDQLEKKTPEFQKLGAFAIEVARLIGADAAALEGHPEGDAYRAAFKKAKQELDDAVEERGMRDTLVDVLGIAVAIAAVVAMLNPVGWVVVGVAAAAGLGHGLIEGADLFDRYYASRFNIEGYADVNGVQPPSVRDWALAALDVGMSTLDLAMIAKPFRAALRTQLLNLTFEGPALEMSINRFRNFDDPEGLARYLRGVKNLDPGSKMIMARASQYLKDDDYLIRLGYLLTDERAAKNLGTMMKGLSERALNDILLKLTSNVELEDARAQLALLARVQTQLPNSAALLNRPGAYDKLDELRKIGSTSLVDRWFKLADPAKSLDDIIDFRRTSVNAGVDGDALIRKLGEYDFVTMLEVASSRPSATAMEEVAASIDLARARGLDTGFNLLHEGYGQGFDTFVFGPVTVVTDYDGGTKILGTGSDRGRAAVKAHAQRNLGANYELSSIYDYLLPSSAPIKKETLAGGLGRVGTYIYSRFDVADEVNQHIKMPPEVFRYSAGGVTKTITINGPFGPGEVAAIKSNLSSVARLNPELLAGTAEIHYREQIGFYEYENQPIQRYDFLARSEASKLYINPAAAANPDELFRELGRDLWTRRSLEYDYESPFVRYGDQAAVSWLGATGPEENFAEAVRRVAEDQAEIRRDPGDYLTRCLGYADTPLEAAYVEEQMAYAIYVVLGIRAEPRRDPPPAPPPGGGGGPY